MSGNLAAHADAVLELVRVPTDIKVFPSPTAGPKVVPAGTRPPYLAFAFAAGRLAGPNLAGLSTRFLMRIYVQCVGTSDAGARVMSDRLSDLLLDVVPTVAGRSCYPIRWESQQPPRQDESASELIVTLTEVYRLESLSA